MILIQIRNENFGLVILDSTQKILGDLEENRSSNINKLMNAPEEVCFETGASLVVTLHYSKGNKANTQTGERSRRSSVFMGDVDAAIVFVAQQDADASNNILAVEAVLREFPPVKPLCVQWDGRALFEVSQHDASKKKKAGGRPSDHNEKDLLEALG